MSAAGTEEEAGEGYFASISDLMIGVLFIFLLMLTVFALNFRDAEEEQMIERARYEDALRRAETAERQAREEEKRAELAVQEARRQSEEAARQRVRNDELRRLLAEAVAQLERDIESRQTMRYQMLRSLEQALKDQGVRVTLDPSSGILRLSGDLLFETGQAVYRQEATQTVKILADALASVLPCYTGGAAPGCGADTMPILETVLVEGHTDRQPYRNLPQSQSQAMNDRLSTERALAVFQSLRQTQSVLDVLRNSDGLPLLGVSGYGERRPLPDAQAAVEEDYRKNRRIDLRFVLSARTSEELQRLRDQIRDVLGAAQ
ncbi:OmpA/MotB family protein [Skermanella pratensis]|uniref:OmpA/MotB family protein n=1 Tax=Skermanella pratensis TaxID=2233999 RepID=UPI0013012CBB|nr:OmpA family protein [Skermanella pratensis]